MCRAERGKTPEASEAIGVVALEDVIEELLQVAPRPTSSGQ